MTIVVDLSFDHSLEGVGIFVVCLTPSAILFVHNLNLYFMMPIGRSSIVN